MAVDTCVHIRMQVHTCFLRLMELNVFDFCCDRFFDYFADVSMQSSTPGCFSVPRLLPRPLVTIKHFLGYYVEPDDDPDQQQKLKRDREEVRRLSRQQGYVEILENAYEPSCTAESSEASEETTPPQATAATTIASRKSKSSLLYRVKRRLHLNSRLRGAAIQRRIGQHGEDQSESISSQDMSHENPVSRQDSGIEEDCSHEEGRLMHVSEVKKQKHDLDRGYVSFKCSLTANIVMSCMVLEEVVYIQNYIL